LYSSRLLCSAVTVSSVTKPTGTVLPFIAPLSRVMLGSQTFQSRDWVVWRPCSSALSSQNTEDLLLHRSWILTKPGGFAVI
jgi:hypothetical protein